MSTLSAVKDVLSSFMLTELFKGMAITGKHFFSRNITVQFPEEKTPAVTALSWAACAASLRKRRRTLHCLQAV